MNSGWILLDASHDALRTVVAGLPADAMELPTPCTDWNVTQVIQHAAGDQVAYAAFLTGEPGPEENPFAPSGSLSGEPLAHVEAAMERSAKAWAAVDRDAAEVPVPMPPNKMAPWLGAGACALDAAVHAWDIAVATGRPSPLTPQLALELLVVARETAEPVRGFAYAAALAPEPGDDEVAALLRHLGRDPHWTP
ncbi:hypothetical protein Ppa06_22210 [Planomonospora parontospora subsp. parontospora]|uniref:Mycothiol-dependent maleylpyruvate isomerase metal-binding domain-containing protein n=2 Tax=Planomonospora parontospora TaxID=58119 RepID=A0AA37F4G4_9ACTN|nr:TIGR03086 family metal-binding protein [Planomonospora parontospora]GGK65950.1 hypothetical protein GCM10010126_26620 [Planomonospora parontospora]GII08423.1 hypothetical protein Ppa06_22210 [Planomonospora parontospora subsp. parontospora]